ncbi:MAG TPA: hypothetical protein VLB72_17320 [Burkholderiales bacterium]|nr:hypothetical protein [Burkholderiales bacterium]
MPVIVKQVSVPLNGTVDNILAGSAFEFARTNALVSMGVTAAATGTFVTFNSGADVVAEEFEPAILTRYPIIPDEMYFSDVAAAGDRLVIRVRNTTGAAIIVRVICQVTPL